MRAISGEQEAKVVSSVAEVVATPEYQTKLAFVITPAIVQDSTAYRVPSDAKV